MMADRIDGKVTWVFDKKYFARQRLKIKALNWMLARMAPESTATAKPSVRRRGPLSSSANRVAKYPARCRPCPDLLIA